jgi:branched-chain amino acid transport system permease protein
MGIATLLIEEYLPSSSQFTADVIPSIPFVFLFVFLIYFAIRGGTLRDTQSLGSALDRAIAPHGGASQEAMANSAASQGSRALLSWRNLVSLGFIVVVALLPTMLNGAWLGAIGLGVAYGTAFLSYTITAGESGMIWLCQITFAGIGAFTTAELATREGWPVLAAMVVGGLICALVGAVIGFLTVRLGDLYVALVTLTFGLLVENIVFHLNSLYNASEGVPVTPPGFASTQQLFAWFALIVFVILALFFVSMRRSTFGLAVSAVRWSEDAARTTGLSVVWTKIAISAMAALVAGAAGGLLTVYADGAVTGSYQTFAGLTWLAVVVAVGVRSSSAALLAGLLFALFPVVFASYLPASLDEVPAALFGLGAVLVAQHPEGTVGMYARQLERLLSRRKQRGAETPNRFDTVPAAITVPRHGGQGQAIGPRPGSGQS